MAKDMTQGKPMALILQFSIPLLIGNLFQQIYSMADTLIVGRTIGVEALAAVGSTGSITFFILGFASGLTSGLAIPLAQKFGAKDGKGVKRSFAVSLVLSGLIGLVLTLLSVLFCCQILQFMQTPPEIIDQAYEYLIVVLAGILTSMAFNLLSNVLRAIGDARTPLYFLVLASIINIVLDYVLIVYGKMGVAGAGIATVFSQLLSALACGIYIWKKVPSLHMEAKHFKPRRSFVNAHLALGLPMAFQTSIIAIGSISIQMSLNNLGPMAVAAYTAASKIDQLAILPLMSFGVAMATYVAQNYGAKSYDRIWRGVTDCIKVSLTFAILVGVALILASPYLITSFVGPGMDRVVSLASQYFWTNASCYSLLSLLFIYRYTLQGLGKSLTPTIAGIMELIMRVLAAIFLSRSLGFIGATMANPLAWLGALIPLAFTYYLFKSRWMRQHKQAQESM